MIRLLLLLIVLALVAFGAAWIADRPGEIVLVWQGWRLETTVPVALAALAAFSAVLLLLWRLLAFVFASPRLLAAFSKRRRREKGWNALSRGLMAIGAGDGAKARSARDEAARYLPHEPLTHLLAAQSAQLDGDGNLAARSFKVMLDAPETRLIALRGLYMEARRAGETESANAYAEEAARQAPALEWAADAVVEARCAEGDYAGARAMLERQMAARGIDKVQHRRRRAVLLAAEAMMLEIADPPVARERALEAVRLAPTLIPAAAVAGRLLGAAGEMRKAAKILATAYEAAPHPDLAEAYAHLRPGDAAQDRLKRVRVLAAKAPDHPESIIALAHATIDALEFAEARALLSPLAAEPTQRICFLMAELEAREHADIGKAREWAARAVRAPRDPAWIADGVVSDQWAAISPVTGRLDAYIWAVPPGVVATPILEHEAERVRDAIAAIPPPAVAGPEPEAPPVDILPPAPEAEADAASEPAPVEPAEPPAAAAKRTERAEPDGVLALPPLPDDPGPLPDEDDAPLPRRKA
ncbi:heme biosynthesis protein HemY [Aquabacter spiritensis]|uniref:HemY protein n=1 Tax=Aquabacter spiritensis TaxID=933073 RepID=A0A4R3LZ72_9HYPH|nr:heme biosynthesis HemY N-terminal domain-containing protein [Aquabacter spiritensis]TCT06044.1 HemY protein [Aquabacter spiritensis]